MDPFIVGAATWLLNQAAGKMFDLTVDHLLKGMGFRSSSPAQSNMQSLLDQYAHRLEQEIKQVGAKLDQDRLALLHGALEQVRRASKTRVKDNSLALALNTFHTLVHLPKPGMTGTWRNAELRCVAFLGMAAAHQELHDSPQLIAENLIAAVQADTLTAEQWLGKQMVAEILAQYPQLQQQPKAAPTPPNRSPGQAAPMTLVVAQGGGGDCSSIYEAVQQASPHTCILVRPGIYSESVELSQALKIKGDGPRELIIWESGTSSSCMTMKHSGQAVIEDLTLRGTGTSTVNISSGQLLLRNCELSADGYHASCVSITGSATTVIIQRCIIRRGDYGISVTRHGQATIEECEVIDHIGQVSQGISVSDGGTARILRCKISNNDNGIWISNGGVVVVESCDIFNNSSDGVAISGGGSFHLSSCKISHNRTGVLVYAGGKGTIERCHFEGNTWQDWTINSPSQVHLIKNSAPGQFGRWLREWF